MTTFRVYDALNPPLLGKNPICFDVSSELEAKDLISNLNNAIWVFVEMSPIFDDLPKFGETKNKKTSKRKSEEVVGREERNSVEL